MANVKISQLTETTSPVGTTWLEIAESIWWTPASKSISIDNLNSFSWLRKWSVWTLSSNTVKGWVLKCIDDAVGDVARTTAWFIEDEKYWFFLQQTATAISCKFDSTVKRTWKLTLKISTTDITGRARVSTFNNQTSVVWNMLYELKTSTKYKFWVWIKWNNLATGITCQIFSSANQNPWYTIWLTARANLVIGSWTYDWTYYSVTFTSHSSDRYYWIQLKNDVAWNISDVWYDVNSMTLEEVKEDTISISTPAIPDVIIQWVTTNDNIDNSLDTWWAYANTYALTAAIDEWATHRQTYTPTKKYTTRIWVWVVAKWTWDWTLTVHDASNVVIAQDTIANAWLTNGAFNYFSVRNIWSSWALHFHLTSTVADWTVKANTSNDLETCSFIQNYAKKTEWWKTVINWTITELKTDMDGINDWMMLDYSKNKFFYENQFNSGVSFTNLYSATAGWVSTWIVALNGWEWSNTLESIQSASDTTARSFVAKVSIWNNLFDTCQIKPTLFNNNVALWSVEISLDNSNWITLRTLTASASAQTQVIDVSRIVKWKSYFFLRTSKDTTNWYIRKDNCQITWTFTPQTSVWLIYPLSINQFTEEFKGSAVTRVYYRLNKFANRNWVVMPALEFTDWSANTLWFVNIPIDNSLETNPSVCLLSTTTWRQNSWTWTNEATTGYILNDWEYMTISWTPTEMKVDYRVGKGTTAFTNITKNTYYLSSNAQSSDSTQDPSLQANILLNLRNQWVQENIQNTQRELNVIKNELANSYKVIRITAWVWANALLETYWASELIIWVPSTASAVTIDLSSKLMTDPNLKIITVVDESWACVTNNITISTQWSETINWSATYVLNANYQSVSLYSNGSNRFIK